MSKAVLISAVGLVYTSSISMLEALLLGQPGDNDSHLSFVQYRRKKLSNPGSRIRVEL